MVLTSRFKHLEAKWQWSCIAGVLQEIVALEGCCRGVALQGYFSGVALQRYCRGVVGCRKLLRCIDPLLPPPLLETTTERKCSGCLGVFEWLTPLHTVLQGTLSPTIAFGYRTWASQNI